MCVYTIQTQLKIILLTKSTYFKLITKLVNTNNNRLNNKLMRSYITITTF